MHGMYVVSTLKCFCSINETHYAAVAGQYYGWSTPYNYLDAYQMQLDTNVLVNGSCLASNDTYDMVVCPSNTYKLPQSEIDGLCKERGLPCPAVSHVLSCLSVSTARLSAAVAKTRSCSFGHPLQYSLQSLVASHDVLRCLTSATTAACFATILAVTYRLYQTCIDEQHCQCCLSSCVLR